MGADRVLAKWPKSLAMAQLQQHFIDHRCSSAKECLEAIEAFDAGKDEENEEETSTDAEEEKNEKGKKKEAPSDDEKEDKKAPKDQSPAPSTASDATSEARSASGVAPAAEETPIRFTMELGGRKIQFSCEPTSTAAPIVTSTTDDAAAKPALPSAKKPAGLSEGSEKGQERAVVAK